MSRSGNFSRVAKYVDSSTGNITFEGDSYLSFDYNSNNDITVNVRLGDTPIFNSYTSFSDFPSNPVNGQLAYLSSHDILYTYDGSEWKIITYFKNRAPTFADDSITSNITPGATNTLTISATDSDTIFYRYEIISNPDNVIQSISNDSSEFTIIATNNEGIASFKVYAEDNGGSDTLIQNIKALIGMSSVTYNSSLTTSIDTVIGEIANGGNGKTWAYSPANYRLAVNQSNEFAVLDLSNLDSIRVAINRPNDADWNASWYNYMAWEPSGRYLYKSLYNLTGGNHEYLYDFNNDSYQRIDIGDIGSFRGGLPTYWQGHWCTANYTGTLRSFLYWSNADSDYNGNRIEYNKTHLDNYQSIAVQASNPASPIVIDSAEATRACIYGNGATETLYVLYRKPNYDYGDYNSISVMANLMPSQYMFPTGAYNNNLPFAWADNNNIIFGTDRNGGKLYQAVLYSANEKSIKSSSVSEYFRPVTNNAGGGTGWSSDGTKFYLVSFKTGQYYFYAWDVPTANDLSSVVTFSTSAADAAAISFPSTGTYTYMMANIEWNANGTQFITAGSNSTTVKYLHVCTVSTAWDITTVTNTTHYDMYNDGFQFSPQVEAVAFNGDGTKLYVSPNSGLYYYDLSTPYDLSTRSWGGSVGVSFPGGRVSGLGFSPDGYKAYYTDVVDETIHEINLSTAYDMSSYNGTFTVETVTDRLWPSASNTRGLSVSPDGNKLTFSLFQSYTFEISIAAGVPVLKEVKDITSTVSSEQAWLQMYGCSNWIHKALRYGSRKYIMIIADDNVNSYLGSQVNGSDWGGVIILDVTDPNNIEVAGEYLENELNTNRDLFKLYHNDWNTIEQVYDKIHVKGSVDTMLNSGRSV